MNNYNPNIHHRKSIRLQGYDYAQAGLYFITICAYERQHLFGEIEIGKNGFPEMILRWVLKIHFFDFSTKQSPLVL